MKFLISQGLPQRLDPEFLIVKFLSLTFGCKGGLHAVGGNNSAPVLQSESLLLRVWYPRWGLLPHIPPANLEGLCPSNSPETQDYDAKGSFELVESCFRPPCGARSIRGLDAIWGFQLCR